MTLSALSKHIGFGWLSLSLLGIVVGMLVAFLDWQLGKSVVLGSISSLVILAVIMNYLADLVDLFHRRGSKRVKSRVFGMTPRGTTVVAPPMQKLTEQK
jgi:hypothetical protein